MHDYNLKRKRVKPQETILDSDRFKVEQEPRMYENDGDEDPNRIVVNYVKMPVAENGIWALISAVVGTVFFMIFVQLLFKTEGHPGMNVTVMGACGILWSIAAVVFSILGLVEKDRNHTLCFVGIALGAFQIITWLIIVIIASR